MSAPDASLVYSRIAREIGETSARRLIDAFGGTSLFVPANIVDSHPIAQAIGRLASDRLSTEFRGENLHLPKSLYRRDKVIELWENTEMNKKQIALATGYTSKWVGQIIADHEGDARQLKLF